jgi:diguanylate cyclase (GGDEF)-like protein
MKDLEAKTLPTELYLPFVESLFKNRGTLWTGMVVHILSCTIVYATTGSHFYILSIGLFLTIFAYRIYWFRRFDIVDRSGLSKKEIESWETRYIHGAAATALLLGVNSAYAVLVLRDMLAAFMCIAVTMASMVSIVGRNYGSARAVGLQTIGCCLPLVIACLLTGELYLALIALFLIPFGLTTQSMARGVREFLYENVLASREMARIAAQFDIALSTMTHALIMLDADGRVQVINRRACELLELPDPIELKGAAFITVMRRSGKSLSDDLLRKIGRLSAGQPGKTLLCLKESVYLEFSLSHRIDGGVVMLFEDVSGRVAAEEKILHLVRYDTLTGLPTRGYFAELATRHLKEAEDDLFAGLVIFDVDGFKHVNDMQGHIIGDKLLTAIAERLRRVATEGIIVARLVGDEFIILATGHERQELEQRIAAIQLEVQGIYEVERADLPVFLNGGGVILDAREFDMEAWQIKADLALNDAKSTGNGMLTMFRPEMDARYVAEQRLKADLRNAIEQGDLNVVYQPMYRPDGSEMECCEALVRWSHPERGFIGPNIFIPMAESMGMISQITRFVLDRACEDCASWPTAMSVSVNLSIHDLRGGQIVARVAETLARHDMSPARLHLEVTESCFMDEPVVVSATLAQLRASGVTIAIDDFGTGFSSLSYLDSLPIDVVKIDRAFVREIGSEPRRLKLLSGIVHLSRELDLKIVIEGVETFEQLELVKKHRFADLVQGYIFSPPVPANAIAELCQKTASGRRMAGRQGRRDKSTEPRAFGTAG